MKVEKASFVHGFISKSSLILNYQFETPFSIGISCILTATVTEVKIKSYLKSIMLHENYKTGVTFYKINTAINHNVHEHWDKK